MADIGSIHDCLLCHPNDAAVLGEVVRRTFVDLYGSDGVDRKPSDDPEDMPEPLAAWRNWMGFLARLKRVEHVNVVLGALEQPGGMGERLLKGIEPRDDGERRAVEHSLDMLEVVRGLDPARRFIATNLLKYLRNHPPSGVGKSAKSPKELQPAATRGLPVAAAADLSDYFFS